MITTKKGDILKLLGGIIVHGCNCQGTMGSGIAAQVREQFPDAYAAYMEDHDRECQTPGDISWAKYDRVAGMPLIIINAYTQDYYGGDGRYVSYDAVEQCFSEVGNMAEAFDLKDAICFPKIGAGLGGGNWEIIAKIIDETLPDSEGFRKYLYVL